VLLAITAFAVATGVIGALLSPGGVGRSWDSTFYALLLMSVMFGAVLNRWWAIGLCLVWIISGGITAYDACYPGPDYNESPVQLICAGSSILRGVPTAAIGLALGVAIRKGWAAGVYRAPFAQRTPIGSTKQRFFWSALTIVVAVVLIFVLHTTRDSSEHVESQQPESPAQRLEAEVGIGRGLRAGTGNDADAIFTARTASLAFEDYYDEQDTYQTALSELIRIEPRLGGHGLALRISGRPDQYRVEVDSTSPPATYVLQRLADGSISKRCRPAAHGQCSESGKW